MTTTSPEPVAQDRRAPRWMWIALILSLALNLLIVGMAAAAMMHFRKGGGGPSAGFSHFVRQLPADRRQPLMSALEQQRAELRPLRRQARQARRRARQAFSAEPFDRDSLAEAYRQASDARMALTTARTKWIMELATLLSAEERQEFLKSQRRHRRHGRRWRRHRDRD